MKVLVIGKPTEAFLMLPAEAKLNLYESFMRSYEQQLAEGIILEHYATPIGYSIAILNYNSADRWVEDQTDMPLLNYMDWEIYPVADGYAAIKRAMASLRKAAGK